VQIHALVLLPAMEFTGNLIEYEQNVRIGETDSDMCDLLPNCTLPALAKTLNLCIQV